MVGFVLRYRSSDGVLCIRQVTWSNYHKIAAEMFAKLEDPAPKHMIEAKLWNELKKSQGQ